MLLEFRWYGWVLVFFLVMLQGQLWLSQGGLLDHWATQKKYEAIVIDNHALSQKNQVLLADIQDLKHGDEAVEEQARELLGMIKEGEQFYQVLEVPLG